jgi:hypothetical protein
MQKLAHLPQMGDAQTNDAAVTCEKQFLNTCQMKPFECSCCGSKELQEVNGYSVCVYCQSKFKLATQNCVAAIDIYSDIQQLLNKCISDPLNRKRYANLILDIDPTNREALKYIV